MPSSRHHLFLRCAAWRGNERGSTAMMFALCVTAIFGMVGVAIDGSRWFAARRMHATAIDSALLVGARVLQSNPNDVVGAQNAAMAFYTANLPPSTGIVNNTVAFSTPDNGQSFTFTGNAYVNTTFLSIVGIKAMPVAVPATALANANGTRNGGGSSNLEIALMLDVTGSMCDDGTGPCTSGVKINGVKTAATKLANIVLGQTSTGTTKRIALVPFSSAIRIDEDGTTNPLMPLLTGLPTTWSGFQYQSCTGGSGYQSGEIWVQTSPQVCTATPVQNWKQMPCVTERTFQNGVGFDASDSAPSANNWLLGHGGDRFPLDWDSTSSTPITPGTTGNPNYSGQTAADPTWQWDYSSDGSGCMLQQGNEILPLTSDLTAVTNRLDTLNAYGPTAGALGTVWTQYMLSPNWNGIWTGTAQPGSYADTQTKLANGMPVLRKVAVLMTDGAFNAFRQGASDDTTQLQSVSNQALQVCQNMKTNGIEIYTVGFNLNALPAADAAIATATLKTCATHADTNDLSHFFNSLTATDLGGAFQDIAFALNKIRLSQ